MDEALWPWRWTGSQWPITQRFPPPDYIRGQERCFLVAHKTFSDSSPCGQGARVSSRKTTVYVPSRANRLRTMKVTVPAAINFTRPRGTPIHARSLQLLVVVSSLLLTHKCRNTYTQTSICAWTFEGKGKKGEEETARSHACASVLCFSYKTDVHLWERIIFRGNRRWTVRRKRKRKSARKKWEYGRGK